MQPTEIILAAIPEVILRGEEAEAGAGVIPTTTAGAHPGDDATTAGAGAEAHLTIPPPVVVDITTAEIATMGM